PPCREGGCHHHALPVLGHPPSSISRCRSWGTHPRPFPAAGRGAPTLVHFTLPVGRGAPTLIHFMLPVSHGAPILVHFMLPVSHEAPTLRGTPASLTPERNGILLFLTASSGFQPPSPGQPPAGRATESGFGPW
uniref:Uncharacterized protein n=1 Tax=Terrapene triunguis TaxID=2587831 RepID=A0A674JEH5_9SAUR